ncbi:MAG: hypothetical protein IPL26_21110 [Leptospiraceae bacterium]|nr:hypothetical protein [Leptospiraceae bacterium]
MIKIHKARNKTLDELAQEHYERIKTKLISKIEINEIFLKDFDIKPNLEWLYDYFKKHSRRIITAKPEEIKIIINELQTIDKDCLKKKIVRAKGKKTEKINLKNLILEIFFYSDYNWSPYQLAIDLGMDTCVYCNRHFISVIGTDERKGSRCEFDHFYAKEKFPYLALSFYNLIPSCHVCNANLKLAIEFDSDKNIHPYSEGFENDVKFTYIPTDYNGLVGSLDFDIKFAFYSSDEEKNTKIRNNISTFKLEDQYRHNKDSVSELIRKKIITSGTYLDMLLKQYPDIFQSKEELYRFVFGNYPEAKDFHKRPLSKLTRDIAEELGLI